MDKENPEIKKIMNTVPYELIISGLIWIIMCTSIVAGMYFIKYPHFTYISVVYNGNQNNENINEFLFTIESSDIEILKFITKAKQISLKINRRRFLGVITNILIQGEKKIIKLRINDIDMQNIPIGSRGQIAITTSKKRMFELIPFFKIN